MKIVAFNRGGGFLETNVVEARKRSSVDVPDRVVRDEEVLFPPHVDKVCLLQCVVVEGVRVKGLRVLIEI